MHLFNTIENKQAHFDGYNAFKTGYACAANPFARGSAAWLAWQDGWRAAASLEMPTVTEAQHNAFPRGRWTITQSPAVANVRPIAPALDDASNPVKLPDKILRGQSMPRHIQIAWGRHIFRLMHGGRNCGLWLRDLPLNLCDLAREYGFADAMKSYLQECQRTGKPSQI